MYHEEGGEILGRGEGGEEGESQERGEGVGGSAEREQSSREGGGEGESHTERESGGDGDEKEKMEDGEVEYDDVSIGTPLPQSRGDVRETKATQKWIADYKIIEEAIQNREGFSFYSLGHGYTKDGLKSIQYAKDLDEGTRKEMLETLQQKQIFIGMTASKNLPRRESVKVLVSHSFPPSSFSLSLSLSTSPSLTHTFRNK